MVAYCFTYAGCQPTESEISTGLYCPWGTVAVPFCLLICLRACAGVHWLYVPGKYGAAEMKTRQDATFDPEIFDPGDPT